MTIVILLLVGAALLLLNAFFVLAEFAVVKVRRTQVDALVADGVPRARLVRRIQQHLDEYLSVCQIGITFASIGLGFVGEPAFARLLKPAFEWTGFASVAAHSIAITVSYILISFLHILIGEQIPKVVALAAAERAALRVALPLRMFHAAFYLPLKVLNGSVNLALRLLRLPRLSPEHAPSEAEVRIILDRSQRQGLMSFRRLLLMENVFDFGDLVAGDVMRPASQVAVLRLEAPWEENRKTVLTTRHSRYPVLEGTPPRPVGVVHVKDLMYQKTPWPEPVDLRPLLRKPLSVPADRSVEALLGELQRQRVHMVFVMDARGTLEGIVTFEDVLEEIVGIIEDEFEMEPPIRLADALNERRVVLDLTATTADEAIREIVARVPPEELPAPAGVVIDALLAREKAMSTELGMGLAVPHARLPSVKAPCLYVARSREGVRFEAGEEHRANVLFVILTATAVPRDQVRLLARIAALRDSDYLWDRLLAAAKPSEIVEAIREGGIILTG